ncbi:MAG: hypothetical protein [Asgard archaea virus VerdaV3]|nr:MAG: hypothetical protein [Asgard archaea virus VerdaV3]
MKEIEIELNLNSITDTMKSLADGIKEQRTTKLIDINGKGISITIACNKEDHFLKSIDKTEFIDTGTFTMALKGPKAKQTSIEDFDEEEADNEELNAEIFELENEPKKAYYKRDGEMHKTKAFEEFLNKSKTKGELRDENYATRLTKRY